MKSQINIVIGCLNDPLAPLSEPKTNPRRSFDATPLRELAENIKAQGVLSTWLVSKLNDRCAKLALQIAPNIEQRE